MKRILKFLFDQNLARIETESGISFKFKKPKKEDFVSSSSITFALLKKHIHFMKKTIKTLKLNKLNSGTSTGLKWIDSKGEKLDSYSPVDGQLIASVYSTTKSDYEKVVKQSQKAFNEWKMWTAPKRGEVVRQIGEQLRKYK